MYKCKYCGAEYTDEEIETGEVEICEALVGEDVTCASYEFEKIEGGERKLMKQEFECLIGAEVTPEEYDKIQTVYVHYPGIEDKDHIARLHTEFGMRIIDDMLGRANTISDMESEIQAAKVNINRLEEKIKTL